MKWTVLKNNIVHTFRSNVWVFWSILRLATLSCAFQLVKIDYWLNATTNILENFVLYWACSLFIQCYYMYVQQNAPLKNQFHSFFQILDVFPLISVRKIIYGSLSPILLTGVCWPNLLTPKIWLLILPFSCYTFPCKLVARI